MDDTMRSCREFTAVLSSAAPTPGGGGAAALTAAVGTALCGMVANLTTGKKAYSAVEGDIQQLLSTTNALQEKLLDQVAADAEGFLPLASVYALPKDAPDRAAKLVQASETACAVPLRIMELCVDALAAAGRLADIGSRLAVSDAGCAAAILGGALRAASLNVLVNTKAMGAAGAPLTERCLALLARGEAASDAVFKQGKDRLLEGGTAYGKTIDGQRSGVGPDRRTERAHGIAGAAGSDAEAGDPALRRERSGRRVPAGRTETRRTVRRRGRGPYLAGYGIAAAAAERHRCRQRGQHRPRMFAAAAPVAPSAGRGAGDL